MSKKIITLFKVIVLSVGMIFVFKLVSNIISNDEKNSKIEYESGDTLYGFVMGTSVSVTLYHDDINNQFASVLDEIKMLDEKYISWRNEESELNNINSEYVSSQEYVLSDILYDAISLSLDVCSNSQGALDITIRPIADVWNIEGADSDSFVVPDMSLVESASKNVGYEKLSLTDEGIVIKQESMVIDLGATGKGYALDIVKNWLEANEIKGACVSVGGSILVYGNKDDNTPWKVGIRDPQGDASQMLGYLEFSSGTDICISTSGYYEKYFMVDGIRYHHIIDRNTGMPADAGLASVTVVCENGLYSDALSTACFVLGYEASIALLDKYNAEAVFVDKDNNIVLTDGLTDIFVTE